MPKRRRRSKREDLGEDAFRVARETTEEQPAVPTDAPATWTTPTEEETPPPKIL